MTQGPTTNGVVFVTIHKSLENTGNVPIDIAAEALNDYGEQIVPSRKRVERITTQYGVQVNADVPRGPVALLFSKLRLRSGTVGGDPTTKLLRAAAQLVR